MRIKLLLIYFFISSSFLSAQQGNIWYFGQASGLNFNTLPPQSLINPTLSSNEGTATICDDNGQLLFYTDGVTVYTKSNKIMANGTDLHGNSSSTQSSLILPWPGKSELYYLFTADAFENQGSRGYNYSIVDMSKNDGEGEVVVKNQLLYNPSTEKLTVALHCNGKDWWVITKQKYNNVFHTYLIDENGINLIPVVSHVGVALTTDEIQVLGGLTVSPDNRKLAMMTYSEESRSQVYDFDNTTGQITSAVTIEGSNYMAAFSPNSKYLYVTADDKIKQYELSSYTDSASLASTLNVINPVGTKGKGIKLGPDGKIYISTTQKFLDVINDPDKGGSACDYEVAAIKLLRTSSLGFPNTAPKSSQLPLNILVQYAPIGLPCNRNLQLSAVIENNVQNVLYEWTFTDGSTSTEEKVTYTFPIGANPSKSDTFIIRLKVTADEILCVGTIHKTTEVSKLIILDPPPKADAGRDTTIVIRQPLQLKGTGGGTYQWSPSQFLNDPSSAQPIVRVEKDQTFTLTITTENGCQAQDQVHVKVVTTSDIYVPNTFTPNNDGNNDFLKVFPIGAKLESFQVFNRWGKLVFITTLPHNMWNGDLNGHQQPTGVYTWMLKGVDYSGQSFVKKGTVLLLR